MAHYLLACADTRSLDDLDDSTLNDLIAHPATVPRYVWCESCTTWQAVTALVIAAATDSTDAADEHDGTGSVPRPRASETDHAGTETDHAGTEAAAVPTPAQPEGARHARRFIPS